MKLDAGNKIGQNGTVVSREALKTPSLQVKAVSVLQDQSRINVKVVYPYDRAIKFFSALEPTDYVTRDRRSITARFEYFLRCGASCFARRVSNRT